MQGFTLVEVLITLFILGFLIMSIVSVFDLGKRTFDFNMGLLDLQQSGRLAMDAMIKELRQTKSSYITISNAGAKIQFKIPIDITTTPATYSNDIYYSFDDQHQLIREHPAGTTKILTNNINNLSFSLSANELEIQLETRKTVKERELSLNLNGKITLRN